MSLRAVRDTIIVRVIYDERSRGIVIPDKAKQYGAAFTGDVISVGVEYKYDVKPGDRIYFRRYEGFKILHKGIAYLCLRAKWVVGKQVEG